MIEKGGMTKSICGTPGYIAPEMYRKPLKITRSLFWSLDGENKYQHGFREEAYDYTIDWWAFGVLVYELLTNSSLWYLCAEDAEVNTVQLWRHTDVIIT